MTAHNLFNYTNIGETVNKSMLSNATTCLRTIELFAGVSGFPCQGYSVISSLKKN